jgi:hypothetical protein
VPSRRLSSCRAALRTRNAGIVHGTYEATPQLVMHLTGTHGSYREVAATSAAAEGGGAILLELCDGTLEVVHLLLHRRCRIRGQLPTTTVVGAGLV